jgi:predicted Zn-dependent protease
MSKIKKLASPDRQRLDAANGWLELGSYQEASAELRRITHWNRNHPFVMECRWKVAAMLKNWEEAAEVGKALSIAMPDNHNGAVYQAVSLHEMKRTQEARDVLIAVADKFPKEFMVGFNLARYACHFGRMEECENVLGPVFTAAKDDELRLMAMQEPDLKPFWKMVCERSKLEGHTGKGFYIPGESKHGERS